MASHRATLGVLNALRERLALRMAALLGGNPRVVLLGSQDLAGVPGSNADALGIYLHRISVDPFSRNRYMAPVEGRRAPRPELPVNLHILLIGWTTHTELEIDYVAAAMQIVGSSLTLDVADLMLADPAWGDGEAVQVLPEEMSTEDLMRLWDSMPGDYRLSSPYLVKTLRLAPDLDAADGPPVRSLVFPAGNRSGE
ncbi:MAG: DUF4255 domain-containing protein [Zoogloea sp.]|nr:DUF4255 domain-containing protein [Zoogloea sp.]